MIDFTKVQIEDVYVHKVGNKLRDEGLLLSSEVVSIEDDDTKNHVLNYFLSRFNNNEIYNFFHTTDIDLNEIYVYAKDAFSSQESLYQISRSISKRLYEKSTHPKIGGGEFCVCFLKDCVFDGVFTDAIGFFKSETKDVFLKFESHKGGYDIDYDNGVSVDKLDKGCLVFNLEEENGYKVCIVDSKSKDTQYWKNDFLNIKPASDNFHFTHDFLSMAKDYITKHLSDDAGMNSTDRIDLLNRSVDYFKTNNVFDRKDFDEKVIKDSVLIESFREFDREYNGKGYKLEEHFEISSLAVKKQSRYFKKVLKLDKNFHIYIHGDRRLIENGIDDNGRKYYKIYYDNES